MAQWLGALVALLEDPSLVPMTHTRWLYPPVTPDLVYLTLVLASNGTHAEVAHAHTYT